MENLTAEFIALPPCSSETSNLVYVLIVELSSPMGCKLALILSETVKSYLTQCATPKNTASLQALMKASPG